MTPPAIFLVETEEGIVLHLQFGDDETGGPIDLSPYDSITFRMRRSDMSVVELEATIDDAPNGLAHFTFASGDIARGQHTAEVVFVIDDEIVDIVPDKTPIAVIVRERV